MRKRTSCKFFTFHETLLIFSKVSRELSPGPKCTSQIWVCCAWSTFFFLFFSADVCGSGTPDKTSKTKLYKFEPCLLLIFFNRGQSILSCPFTLKFHRLNSVLMLCHVVGFTFRLNPTVAHKGHTCKLKMLLQTKNFTCKLKMLQQTKNFTCKLKIVHAN